MNFLPSLIASGGGLSLFRILGSASRAIGIAKQLSPLITEMKPLISKVPVFFERLQNLRGMANNLTNVNINSITNKNNGNNVPNPNKIGSGPVFFQ